MKHFKNKKVAVLGLGLEGKDLVKYLLKQKAEVTVFDQKEKGELDLTSLAQARINFICGKNYLSKGLLGYDFVFRSPGVYRYKPEIVKAEENGVEISSAIKLFFNLCQAKIIGVTGTKGKGTTATLIYQILKKDGKNVYLAGNIGKPPLELLPKLTKSSLVVLELSSFQLIDLHQSPHVAVVLNITTDHLDWHEDRKEYIEAKTNIVKNQKACDFTVLNYDYKDSKSFEDISKAKVLYFSRKKKVKGSYVKDGNIFFEKGNSKYEIGKAKMLKLRGTHNWENVCAAVCASRLVGADITSIKKSVFSFKGLEHRLELVGKYQGMSFYNDSFSTNPQTTIAAINSFDEPTTLVLGGSDKGLNYEKLALELNKRNNVKNIILIGDIALKIKKSFLRIGVKRKMIYMNKRSMKDIVKKCIQNSSRGGVILLSPGSASFDMFRDYKERGELFKREVLSFFEK